MAWQERYVDSHRQTKMLQIWRKFSPNFFVNFHGFQCVIKITRVKSNGVKALRRVTEIACIHPTWIEQPAMIFLHQDLQKICFPGIAMPKPRKARSVSFRHSLIVSVPSFSEKAVAHLNASVPSPKSSHMLFVVVLSFHDYNQEAADHARWFWAVHRHQAL